MAAPRYPITPAVRALRAAGVPFEQHLYDFVEHGGTRHAAAELGVDEHAVIKTIVLQTDRREPLIVLMHGDKEVGVGMLVKAMGAKSVAPCDAATAQKHTGYLLGGTSPFGTRIPLPVYAERTIFDLAAVYINGGKRGFLVSLSPASIRHVVPVRDVDVAV